MQPVFRLRFLLGLMLLFLIFPSRLWAADPFSEPLERVQVLRAEHVVSLRVIGVQPGNGGKVELELRTRAGVRLYATKIVVSYSDGTGFPPPVVLAGDPPAKREFDNWYKEVREFFSAGTIFTLTGPAFERGRELRFKFEACNEKMCLMPTTYLLALNEGSVGVPEAEPEGPVVKETPVATAGPASAASGITRAPSGTPHAPAARQEPAALVTPAGEGTPVAEAASSASASPAPAPVPVVSTEGGIPGTEKAAPSGLGAANSFLVEKVREGGWLLLPFLFLAGLLMNLTPCVYPMIPITLAVLGRSQSRGGRPWIPAALYVFGMALTYAGMGLVVALTGGLFGSLLQSAWVNGAVALLMVFMGLAMLGVVDLSRLQNLGSRLGQTGGSPLVGVVLMGGVSGLVSAPCTGPVLATLLLLVSQTGDAIAGFVFLFVFALGFGAPYFLLGLFSSKVRRMPRIGYLGELVKLVFAALMFGLAVYFGRQFLRPALPWLFERPTGAVVAGAAALSLVLLLLDWKSSKGQAKGRPVSRGAILAVRSLVVAALSLPALWGTLGALKSWGEASAVATKEASSIAWVTDWDEAQRRAKAEGKPVVMDLWADWCAACKEMDAELWVRPEIVTLVNAHFVAVKVDFSTTNELQRRLRSTWQLGGLPAVGFFKAGASLDQPPQILFREKLEVSTFLPAARNIQGQ